MRKIRVVVPGEIDVLVTYGTISSRCLRAIPLGTPLCSAGDGTLRVRTRYQRRVLRRPIVGRAAESLPLAARGQTQARRILVSWGRPTMRNVETIRGGCETLARLALRDVEGADEIDVDMLAESLEQEIDGYRVQALGLSIAALQAEEDEHEILEGMRE